MAYRKFWLINALGNRYDLTNPEQKHFFNEPRGLGFEKNYDEYQVGSSILIKSQEIELTDVTGEIIFYDNTVGTKYQAYDSFIQFAKYKPLELHYLPPNTLEDFYSEVLFVSADKSEVEKDTALHIDVKFHRLTQWLTTNDYTITLHNTTVDSGKYYNLIRPYHYAGNTLSNVPIFNNGTDDVGFIITIDGDVTNPQFSLTQNSEQYGTCKLTGTFDYVRVDSIETEEQIYLENDGSVLSNPKQYQDLSVGTNGAYITFLKLKVGESVFTFTCGNIDTFDGTITITYKNSYVTC